MFHVPDHADVVHTRKLSQTTRYVIEHYGNTLDGAIRSDIRIACAEPHLQWGEAAETSRGATPGNLWQPVEDWEID